jgi:hypothetical protein
LVKFILKLNNQWKQIKTNKKMSEEARALTLYNLPGDIYDTLSDFLDDKSLFVLLTLSPRRITVAKHLLQHRKWRKQPMEHWAQVGNLKALQYLHHRLGRKCPNAEAMDEAASSLTF